MNDSPHPVEEASARQTTAKSVISSVVALEECGLSCAETLGVLPYIHKSISPILDLYPDVIGLVRDF